MSPYRIQQAVYTPFDKGKFRNEPGLSLFGKDFGNGEMDKRIFQLDLNFNRYRQEKMVSRAECLGKYYLAHDLSPQARTAIQNFIAKNLSLDYPWIFEYKKGEISSMKCLHTDEYFSWNKSGEILEYQGEGDPAPEDALDALAMQIQEDFAIVAMADEKDTAALLHLCFPNHWAPEEKIGRSFLQIHQPVADMDSINRTATALMKLALVSDQGKVRFAWGMSTDKRLNHHPEPPEGISLEEWHGRRFTPEDPKLYVRLERQTLFGFPLEKIFFFTIRTYFYDTRSIPREQRIQLAQAIDSMSPASKSYKGLTESAPVICQWLQSF